MNEKINSENYEAFWLDYLEGNLMPGKEKEMFDWLEQHPDLKAELEDDLPELSVGSVTFSLKDHLKKEWPGNSVFEGQESDDVLTADVEGELTIEEKEELDRLSKELDWVQKERTYFEQSKVKPDLSIAYEEKEQLKRKGMLIPISFKVVASAVSVAVLFVLFFNLFNSNDPVVDTQAPIAGNKEVVESTSGGIVEDVDKEAENTEGVVEEETEKARENAKENVAVPVTSSVVKIPIAQSGIPSIVPKKTEHKTPKKKWEKEEPLQKMDRIERVVVNDDLAMSGADVYEYRLELKAIPEDYLASLYKIDEREPGKLRAFAMNVLSDKGNKGVKTLWSTIVTAGKEKLRKLFGVEEKFDGDGNRTYLTFAVGPLKVEHSKKH